MKWMTLIAMIAATLSCQSTKNTSTLLTENQSADFKCEAIANQWALESQSGDILTVAQTKELCEEIRAHIANNLVCIQMGDTWTISSIPDSTTLIFEMTKEQCFASVAKSKHKVVCTPEGSNSGKWKPTHVVTGEQFGRYSTSFEDCTYLSEHAGPNTVCTNTGVYNHQGRKPTRVHSGAYSDNDLLGSSGKPEYCAKATAASHAEWVCACNGDFCGESGWLMLNIQSKKSFGTTMLHADCIKQVPQ